MRLRYKPPMPRVCSLGQTGLLGLALATAGCGGDGGISSEITQFLGTWHYDNAVGSLTCGMDKLDETPRGNKTFATGLGVDVVDVSESPIDPGTFCDFGFDAAGPVATAATKQSCALTGNLA